MREQIAMIEERIPVRQLKKEYPDKPRECLHCQLFLHCKNYKLPYRILNKNAKSKKVLIVCQNPGKQEDAQGRILVGKSGELLGQYIRDYISDFNVYATNAVKCFSSSTPQMQHIRSCSQYLKQDIENIRPDVIVAMGDVAKQALKLLGIEDFEYSTHPAYVLRGGDDLSIRVSLTRAYNTLNNQLLQPQLADFSFVYSKAKKTKICGVDFEWDRNKEAHTVAIATEEYAGVSEVNETTVSMLRDLVSDSKMTIVGHSLTGDVAQLIKLGCDIRCSFLDTLILSRHFGISEDIHDEGLDYFAETYLMMPRYWKDIKDEDYQEYSPKLAKYCAYDAYATLKLAEKFKEDFSKEWSSMENAREVDMSLIMPIAYASLAGIGVDLAKLEEYQKDYSKKLEEARKAFQDKWGINPSSPTQVLQIAGELELDISDTREDTLAQCNHPFASEVLAYRELQTFVTRYLKNFTEYITLDNLIYPSYHISKAVTGRGATSKPNLQNIPNSLRDIITSSFGKDGVLITVDANQSEYRIMAYLSRHKELIEAYQKGVDIHTWASEYCSIPRPSAKTLNFARLYGAGFNKLLQVLIKSGLPEDKAKSTVYSYLKLTRGFEAYQNSLIEQANRVGYVESPYGRRGYRLRANQIVNFPVQSFSADLNKIRLIQLFYALRREGLVSRIWLEFHDGIEIDCYLPEKDKVIHLLKELPQEIPDVYDYGVNLPLPLEIKIHEKGWI